MVDFKQMFPTLRGRWAEINLNQLSLGAKNLLGNALLDPEDCQKWINSIKDCLGCDYAYGGLYEDRSNLWKGSYLEKEQKWLHLGIDYEVPLDTPILSLHNGTVVDVLRGDDHSIGWGGRVILKVDETHCVIYAHLSHDIDLKVGEVVGRGSYIGKIGDFDENGGTFHHLHLQAFRDATGYYDGLDGYTWTDHFGYDWLWPNPLTVGLD